MDNDFIINTNSAHGFALPPVVPLQNQVQVKQLIAVSADNELQARLESGLKQLGSTFYQVPVEFVTSDGSVFKLPIDPIVGISGKNIVTKRYVSKSKHRGSVKERWVQDDWAITIAGTIVGEDSAGLLNTLKELRKVTEDKAPVGIVCAVLRDVFDIRRMVIEDFDFPHTRGAENQSFTIKGVSDDVFELLIQV